MKIILHKNAIIAKLALCKSLAIRDVKVRYAGSSLGMLWNFVHPLVLFVTYYFICAHIFRLKLQNPDYSYAEYLFSGLWPWIVFSEAISRCCGIYVENAQIIKKVMFPIEVLVPSVVFSHTFYLLFGFLPIIFYRGLTAETVSFFNYISGLWVLGFGLLAFIFITIGLGWIVAAFTVFFRDLQQFVQVILNLWFYATPILYPVELVPTKFRTILACNPLSYIIGCLRCYLLGAHECMGVVLSAIAIGLVVLVVGISVVGKFDIHVRASL